MSGRGKTRPRNALHSSTSAASMPRREASSGRAPAIAHTSEPSRRLPEQGCDLAFHPDASRAERVAAVAALGWPRLPNAKRLKQHMLQRVEHEYAEHLLEHGYMPGRWCDECKCICAPAVDAHVAAAADPDPTHDSDDDDVEASEDFGSRLDYDGIREICDADGSNSGLDDPTDA